MLPHVQGWAKIEREEIPAATHFDGTVRLQTVRRDQNRDQSGDYHDLLKTFGHRTGGAGLLNTSLTESEPFCGTPREAMETFVRTNMDVLVLGNVISER
jgi:carbamoyltransferase